MNRTLVLLGTLLLTGPGFSTDLDREADYADAIGQQLEFGEVIRLDSGDIKFLAIYTEAHQSGNTNAAIILHDKDGYPDKKPLIHALRTTLPRHRWTTLSLQVPVLETDALLIDYLDLLPELASRLKSASDYLRGKKVENIVLIGHGLGALMALYAETQLKGRFKAIVAISLPVIDEEIKPDYRTLEMLRRIELPVLDLYGGLDRPEIIVTADKRLLAAKENRRYRQDKLEFERTDSPTDEKLIVKRVYSWLRRQSFGQ